MRRQSRRKRKSPFRGFRWVLLLAVGVPLVFVFFVFALGDQDFGPLQQIMLEVAGPVQKAAHRAQQAFARVKADYVDLARVREENRQLRKSLEECRAARKQSTEALRENRRLRRLLGFRERYGLTTLAAEVVGKDPSLWFRTVIIDRGRTDGVRKGMPVVTAEGIVGQVFAVSPNYAKVLLAIAPSSAIDVLLQKSRVRGILKGTGSLTFRLDYILKTVEVRVGDQVVTAGYSGIFPTGIPVGTVSKVVKKKRGMFQQIEVRPAVDFLTLEQVLVIEKEIPFVE